MAFPWAAAASAVGAGLDALTSRSSAADSLAAQKEFAQKGIRWRVKDATKAGIHPLYALGAQTHSYSPSHVGSNFAGAGQDIGRAIESTLSASEKKSAYQANVEAMTLRRMGLENDILASKLMQLNAAGTPPARPGSPTVIDGQGDSLVTGGGVFSLPVNPANSPAEDWQAQYGESGEWIGGGYNLANDIVRRIRADWPRSMEELRQMRYRYLTGPNTAGESIDDQLRIYP